MRRIFTTMALWQLCLFCFAQAPYPTAPAAPGNIVRVEYVILPFAGTDPGIGNGTALTIIPQQNLNGYSQAINVGALPQGFYSLYIRALDENGKWSITNTGSPFTYIVSPVYPDAPPANANIVRLEYVLDVNIPYGSGIPIAISPGTDIVNLNVVIDLTAVPQGPHTLYIRAMDAHGQWSITNVRNFSNALAPGYPAAVPAAQNLIQAEYFIDTDPGPGNGTPITITPGTNIADIPLSINTTALSVGPHNFYVRSRSADGKWSLTNLRTFQVGTISVLPDSIVFPATAINTTATRSLVVRNNSTTAQTITGVTVSAPFTSNFTSTRTVNALSTDTIRISFSSALAGQYNDTIQIQTSAGPYKTPVKGTAAAVINSWTLDPATGHNYGNVQTGNSTSFNFTIRNTGNASITLNEVSTGSPVFVPTFTPFSNHW